jgi:hypothetical protein
MIRICFAAPSHTGLPSINHPFCGLEFMTFRALLLTAFITYWRRGRSHRPFKVEIVVTLLRWDRAWRSSETTKPDHLTVLVSTKRSCE